jgi:urease accessory protein
MRMPTPTGMNMPTEPSRTDISVARPPGGGRAVVSFAVSGAADRPVLRPMLLASNDAGARVSLVPEGALLLAGDAVSLHVTVGPGARLELVEPAGTVAYAMHGGSASWDVTIDLAPAASLVWAGEPFVVSAGADVTRITTIRMGWDAMFAMRETLVLGRHREAPGRFRQELSATGQNGTPMLCESLDVGRESSPLLLGGARVMGSVLTLGYRTPQAVDAPSITHLDLDGLGTVSRALAHQAHHLPLDAAWISAQQGMVTQPRQSVPESRTPSRSRQPSTRLG